MGKLRALGIAALVVALAALMMRVSCDDAATGSHPADEAARETTSKRAGTEPQHGDAPRPRVRAQPTAMGAAESAEGDTGDAEAAPDSAPEDGETRLLVRVVDEDGATVPGATVRWGRDDAPQETWREGRTDASGEVRVVLTAENVRFVVSHARGIGASTSLWGKSEFLDGSPQTTIQLRRAVTIRGVVVDTTGAGVRGALVNPRVLWVRPIETGADGRFEFPPIPASAVRGSLSVSAAGYATADADLRGVTAETPPSLRVVLRSVVTLRMRLLDESGAPMTAALLERSGTMTIPTLDDGRFALPGQPSPGSMVVAGESGARAHVAWTGAGPEIDLGDVRVAAVRRTLVAVVWPEGGPAASPTVRPADGSVSLTPLVVDEANGVAELHLGAGVWPFIVRATRPPHDASSLPRGMLELGVASVDLRAGDDVRVTLVPAPILVVRAKDADGAPVAFPPKTDVLIGEGRKYRLSTEDDRLAVTLPGEFPMRVTLEVPGHTSVVVAIDAAPGPRIERDVVLVPVKK